jgi:hypothetical protein
MRPLAISWPRWPAIFLAVMAAGLAIAACGSPASKVLISSSTSASKLCAEVFGSSHAIGKELGVSLSKTSLNAILGESSPLYPRTLSCEYRGSTILDLSVSPAIQQASATGPQGESAIGSPSSGVEASVAEIQNGRPLPANIHQWLTTVAAGVSDPPPKS